jgi:peroxiredoxin
MAQLRDDYDRFRERSAEIVVVGPEDADAFRVYWEKERLPFIGLPDPDHKVLKLFGQEVKLFKFGRMPAQVIVDRHGIARYVHYGHSMSDIPTNQDLLAILDELNSGDQV